MGATAVDCCDNKALAIIHNNEGERVPAEISIGSALWLVAPGSSRGLCGVKAGTK